MCSVILQKFYLIFSIKWPWIITILWRVCINCIFLVNATKWWFPWKNKIGIYNFIYLFVYPNEINTSIRSFLIIMGIRWILSRWVMIIIVVIGVISVLSWSGSARPWREINSLKQIFQHDLIHFSVRIIIISKPNE